MDARKTERKTTAADHGDGGARSKKYPRKNYGTLKSVLTNGDLGKEKEKEQKL